MSFLIATRNEEVASKVRRNVLQVVGAKILEHEFVRDTKGYLADVAFCGTPRSTEVSTLTNDGEVKGIGQEDEEGQTARPGTENSPKFTRPVAPPSTPFNL